MSAAVATPTSALPQDTTPARRGHHVELHVETFGRRPTERIEEAERWKAAGVPGSIRVHCLNLFLVSFSVVQVKGALSRKMRDTAGGAGHVDEL